MEEAAAIRSRTKGYEIAHLTFAMAVSGNMQQGMQFHASFILLLIYSTEARGAMDHEIRGGMLQQ